MKKNRRFSTIESTALILSILSLIILLKIYPQLNPNVDHTAEMLAAMEERLAFAETKLQRINNRVCTTRYDTEIVTLNNMNEVLSEVINKSSGDLAIQAKQIQNQLRTLINRLKKESDLSAKQVLKKAQ